MSTKKAAVRVDPLLPGYARRVFLFFPEAGIPKPESSRGSGYVRMMSTGSNWFAFFDG
jgi:hypothetical protein